MFTHFRTLVVRALIFVIVIAAAHSFEANSAHAAGGAAPLTTLGIGSRPLALAGAYAASGDAESFSWNPAGSALMDRPQFFAQRSTPFADSTLNAIAYAAPSRLGVLTFGLRRLDSHSIPKTDASGSIIGSFDYAETVASLNWGRRLFLSESGPLSALRIGAQLKWAHQKIDLASGNGFALDAGVQVALPQESAPDGVLHVGIAAQNVIAAPVVWSNGTRESLERNVRIGIARRYEFRGLDGTLMADWSSLDGFSVATELWPADRWALRGGLKLKEGQVAPAVGIGYVFDGISFDYGFTGEAAGGVDVPVSLGGMHHISINVQM